MSEYKANKNYPQFYPQLAVPPATTSDLQRRVAPLSRFNHCYVKRNPEKAGGGGSTPSLATIFSMS
jgi:hypothetical protein